MRRKFKRMFLIAVILVVIYFFPFFVNEIGKGCTLDDVHPNKISIEEIEYWVKEHNCENRVVFVIPFYEDNSIVKFKEWNEELLELSEKYNFEIGLHGYKHEKFGSDCGEFILPSFDFFRAYNLYRDAFNKKPGIWRSPCLRLNVVDYIFIKLKKMKNFGLINSGKTYHPNNLNLSWCELYNESSFLNRRC